MTEVIENSTPGVKKMQINKCVNNPLNGLGESKIIAKMSAAS
jgi:hypothetical protein